MALIRLELYIPGAAFPSRILCGTSAIFAAASASLPGGLLFPAVLGSREASASGF